MTLRARCALAAGDAMAGSETAPLSSLTTDSGGLLPCIPT